MNYIIIYRIRQQPSLLSNNICRNGNSTFLYYSFQQLCYADPTGNILVSPLSIKATLAMLYEGSANETETELKSALRLPDNSILVRAEFKKLLTQFKVRVSAITIISYYH